MKQVRLIIFCFLLCNICAGQTLHYNVKIKGDIIGLLTVKRTLHLTKTNYLIESQIHVQKIFNFDLDYKIESFFESNRLMLSTAKQISNNRVTLNSKTTWDGTSYIVVTENGKKVLKDKLIDFDLGSMYFNEPLNKNRVWSVSYGKFLPVKPVGNHRYELSLPDGKKNYYTYNYGICSMVETEQLFSKVIFLLTK